MDCIDSYFMYKGKYISIDNYDKNYIIINKENVLKIIFIKIIIIMVIII